MKISGYNKTEYTESLKLGLDGIDRLKDFDLSNPIQINTPSLVNNGVVSQIKDSLSKMYSVGYLDDLSKEQLTDIMQSDLYIRDKNIVVSKWMISTLKKLDDMVVGLHGFLYNNPVVKSFDEDGVFFNGYNRLVSSFSFGMIHGSVWMKKQIREFSDIGDYQSVPIKVYDKDLEIIKYSSHSIVIGDKDDGELTSLKDFAVARGLSESDMIENIFLHEFSHTVHRLKINDVALVDSELLKGVEVALKPSKWQSDNLILGVSSDSNIPIVVNKEVYADVRGLLTYGKLHPEKFDKMLSAVIDWRKESIGSDHDTYLGLIKLQEYMVGKDVTKLNGGDMHKVATNLATMISMAKVKQYLIDDVHVDNKVGMFTGYIIQKPLIENRIVAYNESQENVNKLSHRDFIGILDGHIKKSADVLGLTSEDIHYRDFQKSIDDRGMKIFRDRDGFEIKGSDIYSERIAMQYELNDRLINNNLYSDIEKERAILANKILLSDLKVVKNDLARDGLTNGFIPESGSLYMAVTRYRDLLNKNFKKHEDEIGDMMKVGKAIRFDMDKHHKNCDNYMNSFASTTVSHLSQLTSYDGEKLNGLHNFFKELRNKSDDEISFVVGDIIENRENLYKVSDVSLKNKESFSNEKAITVLLDSKETVIDINQYEQKDEISNMNISKGWKERKAILEGKNEPLINKRYKIN